METNDTFAVRGHQAFPTLKAAKIKRLLRFGEVIRRQDGELMFQAGQSRFGMHIVLQGKIAVSRNDGLGNSAPIRCGSKCAAA
jgi:thioredoxin reductase (NADPH)